MQPKREKGSGRESLPTPRRPPPGPQSQSCRLYRGPAGQPRWAVLPQDGQGDNRSLPSTSQAHRLLASFTALAGIPGSSLSTSLEEHCLCQPSDMRGGCMDAGALCPGFQAWLHSTPLSCVTWGKWLSFLGLSLHLHSEAVPLSDLSGFAVPLVSRSVQQVRGLLAAF